MEAPLQMRMSFMFSLAWYRAYEAGVGRWLSRDPIGEADGVNLYAYVVNRVTVLLDYKGLRKCNAIVDDTGDDWFGRLLTGKKTCTEKETACKLWMANQNPFDEGLGVTYGPMHCQDQLAKCLLGLEENWDSNWIRQLFGCDPTGSWAGNPPKLPEPDLVPPPDFNPETPWDGGPGDWRPH